MVAGAGSTRNATATASPVAVAAFSTPAGRRPRIVAARVVLVAATSAASAWRCLTRSPWARQTAVQ
ncbi:hypothetical protein [Actinoplanes sp. NPDC051411]|uniref:hypothetical protein n=1 Tax=Actinoplanes sp. NPDC051411 TaxID=3155522 RepID=UPI00342622EE